MKHVNSKRIRLFTLSLIVLWLGSIGQVYSFAPKLSLYQLKIYHLSNKAQEDRLDTYLQQAYLPALHRAGISKVGVFKPAEITSANAPETTQQLVYVFIPFKSSDQFISLDEALEKDKQYTAAAKDYTDAAHDNPPYARFESILMEAFSGMPGISVPALKSAPGERIYELRSYESATDKLHLNKVSEFNEGEIKLFDRLGFNAVFYAHVLAGSKMPNLMYMTSFENRAAREEHWKTFGEDPEWKQLNGQPKYANNVSHADITLLHATNYSDI